MAAVSRTTVEETKPSLLSPKSKGKGTCTTPVPRRDITKKRNKTKVDQSSECAEILMSDLSHTDNAKDILCRNVTIYGKCRYEDKGIVTLSRNVIIDLMFCQVAHSITKLKSRQMPHQITAIQWSIGRFTHYPLVKVQELIAKHSKPCEEISQRRLSKLPTFVLVTK